jgi:hypothetical protein
LLNQRVAISEVVISRAGHFIPETVVKSRQVKNIQ